jgi:hypothetical protein
LVTTPKEVAIVFWAAALLLIPCQAQPKPYVPEDFRDQAQPVPEADPETLRSLARSRMQAELDKSMPGHRAGRELPSDLSKKLLPNVALFMILHPGSPCESCPKHLECLGVVEYKNPEDGEGKIALLKTEEDLAELLKRQKPSGREDAARLAAELVQALWRPLKGSLMAVQGDKRVVPENVALEKDGEGHKAVFEYKKGHAYWTVVVTIDKEGVLAGIAVSDTGRATRD